MPHIDIDCYCLIAKAKRASRTLRFGEELDRGAEHREPVLLLGGRLGRQDEAAARARNLRAAIDTESVSAGLESLDRYRPKARASTRTQARKHAGGP